jgi:hypothetical protein
MARRQVWLLALLALALLAAPVVSAKKGGDDDDPKTDDDADDDKHVKEDKMDGKTTYSLGSKWPITKGYLGCIEWDEDSEECGECLEPYFELVDGVCGERERAFVCLFSRGRFSSFSPCLFFVVSWIVCLSLSLSLSPPRGWSSRKRRGGGGLLPSWVLPPQEHKNKRREKSC